MMKKKLLSLLLALCMLLPGGMVFAADEGETDATAGSLQEPAGDADLEAYYASIGDFTAAPTNPYTPTAQKNLLTAEDTGYAYEPNFGEEEEETISPDKYVAGEVLFSRTEGGFSLFGDDDMESDLAALGISGMEEIASYETESEGIKLFGADTETVWYSAKTSGDVLETVEALKELDGIENAEPNFIYTTERYVEPSAAEKSANWSFYQAHDKSPDSGDHIGWWKNRTGTELNAEDDVNPGYGTVVAVIDTGVDYTHTDLAANMWINEAERDGEPGVDDDGNGYIDDIYGCNVLANGTKGGDPQDDHGHGTHVAGIVAMTANNEGAVGLAWGAKIMAVKAGQSTGTFTSAGIAKAINYAHKMHADVINMSFGGTEKSYLVEQALQSAFADCVLVAAAGNSGKATTDALAYGFLSTEVEDVYPAGYTYVLGVMATDSAGNLAAFSNFDFISNGGSAEYELTAPGVNIYSTLPGNRYASWSGTSMAAPQVAAAAAILRSYYTDKDMYSSRFIYGQLASATEDRTVFVDRYGYGHMYGALNIEDSCTKLPAPNIKVTEVFALDSTKYGSPNDGDAVIDAGETIDLGLTVRNQWGLTGDITVTADAISTGGVENPNIEWITNSISLSPAGTYAESHNGYVWDDSLLTNVANPIRFKVKADTPNDYQINIHLTVTTTNGVDSTDTNTYTAEADFTFRVVSGMGIKGEISKDTTLDNSHYWIVENTVLVDEGATLTVEPGTQIQFWSSDYEDAYGQKTMAGIINAGTLNMLGTDTQPISMFPGDEFSNYVVEIAGDGVETLQYCEIVNPRLGYTAGMTMMTVNVVDHCRLVQDQMVNIIRRMDGAQIATDTSGYYFTQFSFSVGTLIDSALIGFRGTSSYPRKVYVSGSSESNLFNDCRIDFNNINDSYCNKKQHNSLFLRNDGGGTAFPTTLKGQTLIPKVLPTYDETIYSYDNAESKYIFVDGLPYYFQSDYLYGYQRPLAQAMAAAMGGTLLCLNDKTEEDFIFATMRNQAEASRQEGNTSCIYRSYFIGYSYDQNAKSCVWEDENPYKVSVYEAVTAQDIYGYLQTDNYPASFGGSLRGTSVAYGYGFVLEVPASLSDEAIKEELGSFDYEGWLFDFYPSGMRNCAIINPLLNTDPDTWATVTAGSYHKNIRCYNLSSNYWGTENSILINKMINDADDYAGTLADIIEDPILTLQSESLADIYPFSTAVWLEDSDGRIVSSVTPGETYEVHVTYNRDMDPDTQPTISYGPDTPYNDFTARFDHWESKREWVGTTTISPVMTTGTMYFKTTGGCADDDHWLVCGNDTLRFKFEVSSTGVLAMLLQAQGGANKVELSWAQNDYETLAGYNIYRSTYATGGFTKINSAIVTGTTFTDTNVTSGTTYYYYFKVVNTEGTEESNVSNTASAAPIDNVKPVLSHTKVTKAKANNPVTLSATAADNVGVTAVKAYYRKTEAAAYTELSLVAGENDLYVGVIPAAAVTADGIDYYIAAYDADGNAAYSGTAVLPHHIVVDDSPYISGLVPGSVSVAGGVTVTILGGNFTTGMTLKVGGEQIQSYSLVDSGQITFLAPAKAIGSYVVTLTNAAKTYTAASPKPLAYTDASCTIQIPTDMEMTAAVEYTIPIYVSMTGSLTDFEASLDLPAALFNSNVTVEKATNAGYYLESHYENGVLKISCASGGDFNPGTASPLLHVKVTPKPAALEKTTAITLHDVAVNGAEISNLVSGTAVISPNFSLAALVKYFKDAKPVEGVSVSAGGIDATTNADGQASLTGITRADVVVSATKNEHVTGVINANDASMILKYSVDSVHNPLSESQLIAADVDGNGKVTAHDASLILQYSVDGIDAFPAGSWKFTTQSNTMTLTADENTVSFTAILIGDVDGTWAVEE